MSARASAGRPRPREPPHTCVRSELGTKCATKAKAATMSGASDALVLFLLLGLVVANEGSNGGLTGAGRDYESVVMKLNDDSFSSAVNKAELMLVMFYAEWYNINLLFQQNVQYLD